MQRNVPEINCPLSERMNGNKKAKKQKKFSGASVWPGF